MEEEPTLRKDVISSLHAKLPGVIEDIYRLQKRNSHLNDPYFHNTCSIAGSTLEGLDRYLEILERKDTNGQPNNDEKI
jgi:hypothetical protein